MPETTCVPGKGDMYFLVMFPGGKRGFMPLKGKKQVRKLVTEEILVHLWKSLHSRQLQYTNLWR